MQLEEAIRLINHKEVMRSHPQRWADLGCGSGLFTAALASLLQKSSAIYAVDKSAHALQQVLASESVLIEKIEADFIQDDLRFRDLDGILMANSLHFVKDKTAFIHKAESYFKAKEYFLIVEYDMDVSNPWVPFPLSYYSLQSLFKKLGYNFIDKISETPSRYNRSNIYSVAVRK